MQTFRYTRDYNLILFSTALTWSIGGLLYPVLSIYAKQVTGDYFYSGLIFAAPFVATVIMSILWGLLSDRLGTRKWLLVIGYFFTTLLFFLYPFLDIPSLVVVRTIQCGSGAVSILTTVLVTEYFPRRKGTAIGDLNLFSGIGGTIGGIFSGWVISSGLKFGTTTTLILFYICGMLSLISTLPLLFLTEKKFWLNSTAFQGLRTLLRVRKLPMIFTISFVVATGGFMIFSIFPAYLDFELHVPGLIIGTLMAASSSYGIIGAGIAGRFCDQFGRKKVLVVTLLLYPLIWLGLGHMRNVVVLGVLWAFPVWSFFSISLMTMVSDLTKERERGRGLGMLNTVGIGLGGMAGSFFGGLLAETVGFRVVAMLSALFAFAGFLLALLTHETLPEKRRIESLEQRQKIAFGGKTRTAP